MPRKNPNLSTLRVLAVAALIAFPMVGNVHADGEKKSCQTNHSDTGCPSDNGTCTITDDGVSCQTTTETHECTETSPTSSTRYTETGNCGDDGCTGTGGVLRSPANNNTC